MLTMRKLRGPVLTSVLGALGTVGIAACGSSAKNMAGTGGGGAGGGVGGAIGAAGAGGARTAGNGGGGGLGGGGGTTGAGGAAVSGGTGGLGGLGGTAASGGAAGVGGLGGAAVGAGGAEAGGLGGATGTGGGSGASGGGGAMSIGDSVLMNHKSLSRDGLYIEPALTKTAAAGLHKLATFTSATLAGAVYAQPLFVDGGGTKPDLVIVATEANNVYALDGATGGQVWMRNLGTPVPLASMPCGNLDPYGVTGTPAIDLATRALFVGAMTTPDGGTTKKHLIFALSIDDGTIKSGWPVDVATSVATGTTTFTSAPQSQRAALAVVGGTVYVPYGGLYGDCGTYHGWLVGVSTTDPMKISAWATAARGGGVWGPGGVASDGTNLYVTTGNTFSATTWGGGEGLLRFTPGAAFATPTYWAPSNWLALDNADLDVGGSGPVLLDLPGATPSALAVALGKDGNAYLLDRNNLGGVGNPLATTHAASNSIITAAAYTTASATYVAFRGNGTLCTSGSGNLATLKIVPGTPPTLAPSWCASASGAGAPIVTTSDGHADAIVWTVGAEADNLLHGYDGDTGAVIFSGASTPIAGSHRFNAPIAAKGRIYAAGDGGVVAFTP